MVSGKPDRIAKIEHDKESLILTFGNPDEIWTPLRTGEFSVHLIVEDDDIGCGKCDTCLTPIC